MLYVRRAVKIAPLILGGSQEWRLRGGTENVPGIVGLAKALTLTRTPPTVPPLIGEGNQKTRGTRLRTPSPYEGGDGGGGFTQGSKEARRLFDLTQYFWKQLQKKIPNASLNGPEIGETRLPNNLNITFEGIDGEVLLLYLDSYGISCSVGSACAAEEDEPSQVLSSIGRTLNEVRSSVRFTLGRETTKADIDYTLKHLPGIVSELRKSASFTSPPSQRRGQAGRSR